VSLLSNDSDSLPRCLVKYLHAVLPNRYVICPLRDICRYVAKNFVPRRAVLERLIKV